MSAQLCLYFDPRSVFLSSSSHTNTSFSFSAAHDTGFRQGLRDVISLRLRDGVEVIQYLSSRNLVAITRILGHYHGQYFGSADSKVLRQAISGCANVRALKI